jgi:hypothetical protein
MSPGPSGSMIDTPVVVSVQKRSYLEVLDNVTSPSNSLNGLENSKVGTRLTW